MEAEILFPISKETAEWNCSVCKIDVHLYASIVCEGCLEWNHLTWGGGGGGGVMAFCFVQNFFFGQHKS